MDFENGKCAFKYAVFFRGIVTRFHSSVINRRGIWGHDSMTQTPVHRFSKGITKIVVTKTMSILPELTRYELQVINSDLYIPKSELVNFERYSFGAKNKK